MKHHVTTYANDEIIGEAETKDEAIGVCRASGYDVIPEDDGGNIDFYDAEDGPYVQGYIPDGRGVWIVACR